LRALLSREFPRIGYLGDQLLGVGADGDVRVSGNGFDVRNAAIGPRPPAADAVEGRLIGRKTSWSSTKGEESGAGAVIIL
jgi:hypothetical protein